MKYCLDCNNPFQGKDWRCPACGYGPEKIEGIQVFSRAADGDGFRDHFFQNLAALEENHFWFQSRIRLICHFMLQFFPKAKSFLDLGCGTGFNLAHLSKRFSSLALNGADYFFAGLPFAVNRVPQASFYQVDARRLPFLEEFDVVGAFDVLEHIDEDDLALASIVQAIKPGGGAILTVPQHPWLWSRMDDHACHKRRYDRHDLLRKIETAGLRVEHDTSFVSLLLPAMLLSRYFSGNDNESFDPLVELRINPFLNKVFHCMMTAEFQMLRLGISLHAGGSILVVARKL